MHYAVIDLVIYNNYSLDTKNHTYDIYEEEFAGSNKIEIFFPLAYPNFCKNPINGIAYSYESGRRNSEGGHRNKSPCNRVNILSKQIFTDQS